MQAITISIHSMKESDLELAFAIQQKCYQPPLVEEWAVFQKRFLQVGENFLVAKNKNTIVGYAIIFPWQFTQIPKNNEPLPAIPSTLDCLYLHDIGVDPDCRGMGIADDLLEAMTQRARRLKLHKICLVAIGTALAFWQKQQFKPVKLTKVKQTVLHASYGIESQYMERILHY